MVPWRKFDDVNFREGEEEGHGRLRMIRRVDSQSMAQID